VFAPVMCICKKEFCIDVLDVSDFYDICRSSMQLVAAFLQHDSKRSLVRFFVWHGILFVCGTSLFGKNISVVDQDNGSFKSVLLWQMMLMLLWW